MKALAAREALEASGVGWGETPRRPHACPGCIVEIWRIACRRVGESEKALELKR